MYLMYDNAISRPRLRLYQPRRAARTDWSETRAKIDLVKLAASLLGTPSERYENGQVWLRWHCPFHLDLVPSLAVVTGAKTWACAGCEAGGDAAALAMRIKKIGFRDAVRWLDEQAAHAAITTVTAGGPFVPALLVNDEPGAGPVAIADPAAALAFDGQARNRAGRTAGPR
jgi:hypothetical protein